MLYKVDSSKITIFAIVTVVLSCSIDKCLTLSIRQHLMITSDQLQSVLERRDALRGYL